MSVTPNPGLSTVVAVGGNPVVATPVNIYGGIITNPQSAADQGVTPEVRYVNPVGNATLFGNNANFVLQPGQSWNCIPGQTTQTTVTAASSGHKFSCVWW